MKAYSHFACGLAALVLSVPGLAPGLTVINTSTVLGTNQAALYAAEDVVVDGAGVVLTLTNNAAYGTLAVYQFNSLVVTNGAAIVCKAQIGTPYNANARGIGIQVPNDLYIAANSSIHADGQGYPSQRGPGGVNTSTRGGSHGGAGYNNTLAFYGNPTNPVTLGSGGDGYPGGGAIKLIVGGVLTVEGTNSANGNEGDGSKNWGGGAGGSIWITGGCTLKGGGKIQTFCPNNRTDKHGGGGGRIAIDDTVTYQFTGSIETGKKGGNTGGCPGTLYLPAAQQQNFTVLSNQTIVIGNGPDYVYEFTNLTIAAGGRLEVGGVWGSMDGTGPGTGTTIRATSIVIETNGVLTTEGWGWTAGRGSSPGGLTNGASHGGIGIGLNATNQFLYGSITNPTSLGSGGNSANTTPVPTGGGAIKLVVVSNLTVHGTLSANGANGGYYSQSGGWYVGGAAGGSIWITGGGKLTGDGQITAIGGSCTTHYYLGGGGRIAIADDIAYEFTGCIRAGASGSPCAGTVYLPASARQDFTVVSNQTITVGPNAEYAFGTLTVKNGGALQCGFIGVGEGTGCTIRAHAILVETNGSITADGMAWPRGWGPAGRSGASTTLANPSHGGFGSTNAAATRLAAYGSVTNPISCGSGGYLGTHGGGAIHLIVTNTLTVDGTISANGQDYAGAFCAGAGGSLWIETGTLAGTGTLRANGGASTAPHGAGGGRIAVQYANSSFTGLPAKGSYTNQQLLSATVTVKGGYNASADGPEDGSLHLAVTAFSRGTVILCR